MGLRASYMLGKHTTINPFPSTLVLKLSLSESLPLEENGSFGVIIVYEISLKGGHLLPAGCSDYSNSVNKEVQRALALGRRNAS